MAMKLQTPAAKVERLLAQHAKTIAVLRKHALRLAAAHARLDSIDGDLEMYAQHRAVTGETREAVTAALVETEALLTAIAEGADLGPEDDAETETDAEGDNLDDVTVPDDASELV